MSEQQLQFWQKSWFMWLCLIFLTPIGIIICYINRERHPQWKAICGIFAVLLIIGVVLPKDDVNPKQNDKPVNTVENKQISKPKQTSNVYVTNDGKKYESENIHPEFIYPENLNNGATFFVVSSHVCVYCGEVDTISEYSNSNGVMGTPRQSKCPKSNNGEHTYTMWYYKSFHHNGNTWEPFGYVQENRSLMESKRMK